MRILSVFDGISCAWLAAQRAGIIPSVYFASEIDRWAIQVSSVRVPSIRHLGDISNISSDNLPSIDLLIGGSPCQGFSRSNSNAKGFSDPRSRLFFEFVRLLDIINPTYFLLENVIMKQEWKDVITNYVGVDPIQIDSALVSAQSRKRYYWTNIPHMSQPADRGIFLQSILVSGETWLSKGYAANPSYRFGAGDPNKVMRKLSRGEYPNQWERRYMVKDKGTLRKLLPVEYERLQTVPDGWTNVGLSNTQRYKCVGNAFTVDVISHFLKGECI